MDDLPITLETPQQSPFSFADRVRLPIFAQGVDVAIARFVASRNDGEAETRAQPNRAAS
jgi:hypothetical protein